MGNSLEFIPDVKEYMNNAIIFYTDVKKEY